MASNSCVVCPVSELEHLSRFDVPLLFKTRRFSCIRDRSQIEKLSLFLIVLSLFDLLVTYTLLYNYFPDVYEANPVAAWFFLRWNILGMTLFKFSLVASVIIMGEIIERHRRGLGKTVMIFACIAAGAVIFQGLQIYSDLAFEGLAG
jgi:hypothetical protein